MHEVPGKVYWAELQGGLSDAGLEVIIDPPFDNDSPWNGDLDGKLFLMDVSAKNPNDGLRDSMVFSFFGQDETVNLPRLSEFMGYAPFAKYRWKSSDDLTATYEWSRDPNTRIGKLEKDVRIRELQRLEDGFRISERGMDTFYQQCTPEVLEKWEEAIKTNPDVEFGGKPIKPFLPFLRTVMPRIPRNQSLSGLTLISLESKPKNESEIVMYGLEPLLAAGVIAEDDATEIREWFIQTQPTWEPTVGQNFEKDIEVSGIRYRLITDSYRNSRDLNLQGAVDYGFTDRP